MSISKLRKIVTINSAYKKLMSNLHIYNKNTDYDKYVKISQHLDKDTFEYVNNMKNTLGKFAHKNNIQVSLDNVKDETGIVNVNVFFRENPVLEKLYDILNFTHDEPVKINKTPITIKINPDDTTEKIPPSHRIYRAVRKTLKDLDYVLNSNLKQ